MVVDTYQGCRFVSRYALVKVRSCVLAFSRARVHLAGVLLVVIFVKSVYMFDVVSPTLAPGTFVNYHRQNDDVCSIVTTARQRLSKLQSWMSVFLAKK